MTSIDEVYTQRMIVVCMFAKAMGALGYAYGLGRDEDNDWEDEWRNVIYVDTPQGQVSWHIAPSDLPLFTEFPKYEGKWDGLYSGGSSAFAKTLTITNEKQKDAMHRLGRAIHMTHNAMHPEQEPTASLESAHKHAHYAIKFFDEISAMLGIKLTYDCKAARVKEA